MRRSTVPVGLLAVVVACLHGSHHRLAFDASQYGPGPGWFCHTVPYANASYCQRTQAACDSQRQLSDGATACEPRTEAFCFSAPDRADSRDAHASCSETITECQRRADRMAQSRPPTECGRVQ